MSYYLKAQQQYPNDSILRRKFLNDNFKIIILNIKKIIKCFEIDIKTQSMTYVFEHIKDSVVSIISLFVSPDDKVILDKKQWNDLKYRRKIFDVLVELEYKPIMIWIFFHFNYFKLDNLDQQRTMLMENIDMFYKNFPKSLYFKDINELFTSCPSSNPLFSISYQNRNNKTILENYSKLLRKICPDLNYNGVGNRFLDINSKGNKIKVCFFSEFLTMDSSVLRDRIGIITKLPRDKFEVYYMGFTPGEKIKGTISKTFYDMLKQNYIMLPSNIVEARKFIEKQKFDIIVYCELGMLMNPLYLAYARLAPIQITTWGHSETSGIDTIDYYVSSKYFEIEESQLQNHYSEKLCLMDSLSTYYYPPSKLLLPDNYVFQTRKDFNLDDSMNIYGCIQSSFKISEDFEKIMDGILKTDPKARILMSYNKPFCKSQAERMTKRMGVEGFKRLLFLPGLEIIKYMNLIKLMDVMIDPYPFGGCNTSMEAFDLNVPVVTMPTKYLNGRFTFGMYKKMGFVDMVADSPQNYIKIAVKTANDRVWRETIKEKINKNKHLLFQEKASINDWSNLLSDLYQQKALSS
jgi:predicted O-linked N-acetylglucosamine transferase (SPINDLY family)